MTRRIVISPDMVQRQRRAADPGSSIWVEANAGSGKTYVLVERVLRLLLSGVRPESILCLTYTKAAAAVMRERVSARLATWALLPDEELDRQLFTSEGRAPDAQMRLRARTLFAQALETPGGLKIVTIHAFCESVLHRFPLEAGVPFDFSVIEEPDQEAMVRAARESVLAGGVRGDGENVSAVASLFELLSDSQIITAIDSALAEGRKLRPVLADRRGAKARLRRLVGANAAESRIAILERAAEETLFPAARCEELFALVPPDPRKTRNLGLCDKLWATRNRSDRGAVLFSAFLKDDGEPYADRRIAGIPAGPLAELAGREHDRLAALYPLLRRAELVERSEALLDVLGAISDRYERDKRARSLLDFDDLIERLGDLFANPALGPWVQYKLDAGVTHILVDESQDTNPEQWRVVREIAREFFTGQSAVEIPRTLFAVGDEKQSIYSFQGADPALFGASGRLFAQRAAEVGKPFADVRLHTSFRTLPGVLKAVDLVFAPDELREAVRAPADRPVHHDTARAETGGIVTLWPPVRQEEIDTNPDAWPQEVTSSVKSAPRQVAERIAREIKAWVAAGRTLGPRQRPVRPDDVLILVQTRGPLFREIIRALVRERLPTPGADRLEVTSHIAILDLLALADVLLNPADDLQLAAVLRSPLFEVSESDLFALAHGRPGTLWTALANTAIVPARQAYEVLHHWRGRLDFDRPFRFYAEVLYAGGGLRRFHARMGAEVDDVLAEFLDLAMAHEQSPQPSLQGFVVSLRAREVVIKRELSEAANGVRVMTVHGAKGLEAPIVILADAATTPAGKQQARPVFIVPDAPGPLLVHASNVKQHVPVTADLRDRNKAAQQAEYWRMLYVGMTRAEDELYVTGALTRTGKLEGSWYEAIDKALRPLADSIADDAGVETALLFPRDREPLPASVQLDVPAENVFLPMHLPPLPEHKPVEVIRPSSAFASSDPERAYDTAADSLRDPEMARQEGIALHALLQHLVSVDPGDRERIAARAMPALLPDLPGRHSALARKAIAILGRAELAFIFAENSRAEVPFLAPARRNGVPVRLAGRIDRILIEPHRVLVVDFKSDAAVPADPASVPNAYRTQLGLYAMVASLLFPERQIEAAILWTWPESFMILPQPLLSEATAGFTMA